MTTKTKEKRGNVATVKATAPVGTANMEPIKSRYSDEELKEFDKLIDDRILICEEQIESFQGQLEALSEDPGNKIKSLEDGTNAQERENVSNLLVRQLKLLRLLQNAKSRIKNKVYGICRETGKLIPKERLRAVPHATLSIEAKQA